MSQFTLLYGARQLLTLRGPSGARRGPALQDLGIIENGSVLLRDGLVHAVGPTRRIENLKESRAALIIDVSGSIVMPGLIDPDFHVTYPPAARGVSRSRRAGRVYEHTSALLRSCLQHGTLAAALKTSAGERDFRSDVSLLRLLAKLGDSTLDAVRTWHIAHPPASAGEVTDLQETLALLSRRRWLHSISLSADAAYALTASNGLETALARDFPFHLHWGSGDCAALRRLLAAMNPWTVACSPHISNAEVDALATSPTVAIFAPTPGLTGPMNDALRRVAQAGGAVALSSGHHPVDSPGFSMQMAISLAIVQGQLSPEEAITAATVNAAHAAGRGAVAGTLESGKRGDILVMNVPDYRDIARQFGINHVVTALRSGQVAFNQSRRKMVGHETAVPRVRAQHIGRA